MRNDKIQSRAREGKTMIKRVGVVAMGLLLALMSVATAGGPKSQPKKEIQIGNTVPAVVETQRGLAAQKEEIRALLLKLRATHDKAEKRAIMQEIRDLHRNHSALKPRGKHVGIVTQTDSLRGGREGREQSSLPTDPQSSLPASVPHVDEVVKTYHVPFASTGNRIELAISNG